MNQYRKKDRNDVGSILMDVAFGLVAGAAATFVMDKVSGYLYELEDEKTRKYEETLRNNEYPPEILAEKISETVADVELNKEQKEQYGNNRSLGLRHHVGRCLRCFERAASFS